MNPQKLKRAVIKQELVALTGDYISALILNQFIYWSERTKDADKYIEEEKRRNTDLDIEPQHGWIYKKADELNQELMLNLSGVTLRRYIGKLIDSNLVAQRHNLEHKYDRTLQYRPDILEIQRQLQNLGYALEEYPLYVSPRANLQNEECIPLVNEESNLQNEASKLQDEASKLQNEGAIPDITPEITPKITLSNQDARAREEKPKLELKPNQEPTNQLTQTPINQTESICVEPSIHGLDKSSAARKDPFFNRRSKPNENYGGVLPLENWEIAPGEPYPYFWAWRSQHYLDKGGDWAKTARSNAYSEFYNNRSRALVLWQDFLAYYNLSLENALAIQGAGLTPSLPNCFNVRSIVSEADIAAKVQSLGQGWEHGLLPAVADGKESVGKAIAETHASPTPVTEIEISAPPESFCTAIAQARTQGFAKLTAHKSISKKKQRIPEHEDIFAKYRSWLKDPVLSKEAQAWVMRRNDLEPIFDENGNVTDFMKVEF